MRTIIWAAALIGLSACSGPKPAEKPKATRGEPACTATVTFVKQAPATTSNGDPVPGDTDLFFHFSTNVTASAGSWAYEIVQGGKPIERNGTAWTASDGQANDMKESVTGQVDSVTVDSTKTHCTTN